MRTGLSNFFYKLIHWESWHHHAKYIPLLPVWLWYCLRARSMWFFTASNPTLTFGGMDGEGKEEMYAQLPPKTYPNTIYVSPEDSMEKIENELKLQNIKYPFAAKPDVGMSGYMFRKIRNPHDLLKYHAFIPVKYLLQDFATYPTEVSVFYYRHPSEKNGTISGMAKKDAPVIMGDGMATVGKLIDSYRAPRFHPEKIKAQHTQNLNKVLMPGKLFMLSEATNRNQGGKITGVKFTPNPIFTGLFDDLSLHSGQLFYGRYDIKCASIEDLMQGKNFTILEYNGSGSGIQHIFGNGTDLITVWRIILNHWKMLYTISKYNNEHGVRYWKFWIGLKFIRKAKRNLNTLKQLDAQFPHF